MTTLEFSQTLKIDHIPERQILERELTANEEERKDLAKRFNILSIEALTASLSVTKERSGIVVKCIGTIDAKVTQACIITLKDVPEVISTKFESYFTTEAKQHEEEPGLEVIMPSETEEPEYIHDGQIDLGELVAQHLSLSLNSYPKAEGADTKEELEKNGIKDERTNPFSVLKDLNKDKT